MPIFWRQFVRESILIKKCISLSGWFAVLVAARLISLDIDITPVFHCDLYHFAMES